MDLTNRFFSQVCSVIKKCLERLSPARPLQAVIDLDRRKDRTHKLIACTTYATYATYAGYATHTTQATHATCPPGHMFHWCHMPDMTDMLQTPHMPHGAPWVWNGACVGAL